MSDSSSSFATSPASAVSALKPACPSAAPTASVTDVVAATQTGCRFNHTHLRFDIPLAQQAEAAQLKRPHQQKLDLMLAVMGRCYAATNKKAAYQSLATELKKSGQTGVSAGSLKRRYNAFRDSGWDWRTLVPKYHRKDLESIADRSSLPAPFIKWWQGFACRYSGGTRAAHSELERRWTAGETIPGLGSWMQWWQRHPDHRGKPLPTIPPPLPPGCSYWTLLNKLPNAAVLTIARQGVAAALGKHQVPIMRRDRSQLRPLERVAFDDHPLNFRVLPTGANRAAKLLGLFAVDHACGCCIDHAAGARLTNDRGVERSLTRMDARGLTVQFLKTFGVPKNWTMHLVYENASCAISHEDGLYLERVTNGRIKIIRTPVKREQVVPGGAIEKVASPQAKGEIESYFNLLDRAMSYVPGQAGSNPLTAKSGTIDDIERETKELAKLMQGLPEDFIKLVALSVLTEEEALVVLSEIITRLNNRTNHRLQGFDTVRKWRIRDLPAAGNPWRPRQEIRDHLLDVAEWETFVESPQERFMRLYNPDDFEPVPDSVLAHLMDAKRSVTVARPYQIDLQRDRRQYTYWLDDPRLENAGTKFQAIYQPQDLDIIYLRDLDGCYIGAAHRWQGPNPTRGKEIGLAASEVKKQVKRLLTRARDLQLDHAEEELNRRADSMEALEGQLAEMEAARLHLTDEERANFDRQDRQRKLDRRDQAAAKRRDQARAQMAHLSQPEDLEDLED